MKNRCSVIICNTWLYSQKPNLSWIGLLHCLCKSYGLAKTFRDYGPSSYLVVIKPNHPSPIVRNACLITFMNTWPNALCHSVDFLQLQSPATTKCSYIVVWVQTTSNLGGTHSVWFCGIHIWVGCICGDWEKPSLKSLQGKTLKFLRWRKPLTQFYSLWKKALTLFWGLCRKALISLKSPPHHTKLSLPVPTTFIQWNTTHIPTEIDPQK